MFYSTKEFQKYNLAKFYTWFWRLVLDNTLHLHPPKGVLLVYFVGLTTTSSLPIQLYSVWETRKEEEKENFCTARKALWGEKYKIFVPIIGMSVFLVYILLTAKENVQPSFQFLEWRKSIISFGYLLSFVNSFFFF